MKYPNFKLIQDFEIKIEIAGVETKQIIHKKGEIFTANEKGEYIIEYLNQRMVLDVDSMRLSNNGSSLLFQEEISKYEIIIEEISDDDDKLVSNWRIQLDVKTTKKKLKEVEKIIRDYVTPILYD